MPSPSSGAASDHSLPQMLFSEDHSTTPGYPASLPSLHMPHQVPLSSHPSHGTFPTAPSQAPSHPPLSHASVHPAPSNTAFSEAPPNVPSWQASYVPPIPPSQAPPHHVPSWQEPPHVLTSEAASYVPPSEDPPHRVPSWREPPHVLTTEAPPNVSSWQAPNVPPSQAPPHASPIEATSGGIFCVEHPISNLSKLFPIQTLYKSHPGVRFLQMYPDCSSEHIDPHGTLWQRRSNGSLQQMHLVGLPKQMILNGNFWWVDDNSPFLRMYSIRRISEAFSIDTFWHIRADDSVVEIHPNNTFEQKHPDGSLLQMDIIGPLTPLSDALSPDYACRFKQLNTAYWKMCADYVNSLVPQDELASQAPFDKPNSQTLAINTSSLTPLDDIVKDPASQVVQDVLLSQTDTASQLEALRVDPHSRTLLDGFLEEHPDVTLYEIAPDSPPSQMHRSDPDPPKGKYRGSCAPCASAKAKCDVREKRPCTRCIKKLTPDQWPDHCKLPVNQYHGEGGHYTTSY
ncbi:hypothetical protein SCHPADRAFT_174204 [Schizopora paradoxa]|uniref:Uncharacterized protein n=1 Tax=Schizopora paradoxa TaxID=27342 RepID=A0A0H2S014_9AGAM|nr:hypothetical protein SCHPADRAFT_174204 [Schizopora paradoxa]